MRTRIAKRARSLTLTLGAMLTAGVMAGCSQAQLTSFVTGRTAHQPAVWVIEADTSGSTTFQTVVNGPYEHEILSALAEAARKEATVYAGPIDGNAIGDAGWLIDGARLSSTAGGGNAKLAELARVRQAGGLRNGVRRLLSTRLTNGSDILGALQAVSELGRNMPADTSKVLVLLTDGEINLSRFGGYDIYTDPPYTRRQRRALVARFTREGELPQLSGWRIYLGGIGVGNRDRRSARATVLLWNDLVPAMHATLVQDGATLAFGIDAR
jgi:hypothetical protein